MTVIFEQDDVLEKVLDFCHEQKNIVALYIFGSTITGRNRRGSDVDLAVMVWEDITEECRVTWETLLSKLVRADVDLVVFSRSLPLLQHQILKYGRLVYERDSSERIRQEVFSRSEYLDSKELFKEIR